MISSSPCTSPSPTLPVPSFTTIHRMKPSLNGQGSTTSDVLDPLHRAEMDMRCRAVVSFPAQLPASGHGDMPLRAVARHVQQEVHRAIEQRRQGHRAKAAGGLETRPWSVMMLGMRFCRARHGSMALVEFMDRVPSIPEHPLTPPEASPRLSKHPGISLY